MRHLFVFLLLCGQLPAQVLSKEETLNNHIRSRTQTIAYPSLLKSSVVKDIYDTAARLIEEDRISLSDERKTDETRTLFSFCDDGSLGYTLTYRNDTLTDSTVIAHAFPAYETRSYLHGRLYACEQWSGDSLHRKIVRMTLSSNDTFRDVREIFNTYGPGGKRMERNVIEVYSWYGRTDTISDEKTRYFGDLHTRITDRFDNSGYGNYEWSRDSIRKTETFVFFSAKGKITGKNVICFSDSGKVLRDMWLDKKGKITSDEFFNFDSSGRVSNCTGCDKKGRHTQTFFTYDKQGLIREEKYLDARGAIDTDISYAYEYY